MTLDDAKTIINLKPRGAFRITYEHSDGGFRTYSCFPSVTTRPAEPAIAGEEEAWALAEQFAATAPDSYENITVVCDGQLRPAGAKVLRPRGAGRSVAGQHDWMFPTTVHARMSEAVSLLCAGSRPPAEMVAGWLCDSEDHRLQEFALEHGPAWAQGIALLDAAWTMANQPAEGEGHELAAQPAAPAPCQFPACDCAPITPGRCRRDQSQAAPVMRAPSTAVVAPEPPKALMAKFQEWWDDITMDVDRSFGGSTQAACQAAFKAGHAVAAPTARDGRTLVPGGYASWEHLARGLQAEVDRLTACVNAGALPLPAPPTPSTPTAPCAAP